MRVMHLKDEIAQHGLSDLTPTVRFHIALAQRSWLLSSASL